MLYPPSLRLVLHFCLLSCNVKLIHRLVAFYNFYIFRRFQENDNALLIATDVAARGLDIPNVEHVIHYQVPRTSEVCSRMKIYCSLSFIQGVTG